MPPSTPILVTGGHGFLGSAVVERLRGGGYANILTPRHADYDLTREADVERLYRDLRPAVVLHLAGFVGGIGAQKARPAEFFHANLAMGMHLMEHGRRAALAKFVQIGTICAYPRLTPVPFRESALWDGHPDDVTAPYGLAKKALLTMGQAYRQQYDMSVIHLMPVNLYGPRDRFDAEAGNVVPSLIRKCVDAADRGEATIQAWGTGAATREFLYVDDCADAVVLSTERYDSPEPVNVGTGRETSIKALAELTAALSGFRGAIRWDPTKPEGHPRRCLDVSRAREQFGFTAKTSLEEGLRATIDGFRAGLGQGRPPSRRIDT